MEENNEVQITKESSPTVYSIWRRLHIKSPIGMVWYWFFLYRIKRSKVKLIWEANLDRFYFESKFAEQLSYVEDNDRKALMAENQKPLAEQDRNKIDELENRISTAKAVKQQYRRVRELILEAEAYLTVFDAKSETENNN